MAMQKTAWRPDTCGCEIHYEWDDALPADQRTLTEITQEYTDANGQKRKTIKCPSHGAVQDGKVLDVCTEENQRKNNSIKLVYENGGKYVLSNEEKAIMKVLYTLQGRELGDIPNDIWKEGVKTDWQFDPARKLKMTLTGIDTLTKTQIKDLITQQFGDKVDIL